MRARYYSPTHGRFTQVDTARDGLNWYAYCDNNPVNRIDPSGMYSLPHARIIGGPEFTSSIENTRNVIGQIVTIANEAQKSAQRAVWKSGAKIYLNDTKGYSVSAFLLEHACQDNPTNLSFGNESKIADLIKSDSTFGEMLKEVVNNNGESISFSDSTSRLISFEGGTDLFYSLHTCSISFSGTKQKDGSWNVSVHVYDVYDYTEFTTMMGNNGISLGSVANDVAVISQATGALTKYEIEIDFEVTCS